MITEEEVSGMLKTAEKLTVVQIELFIMGLLKVLQVKTLEETMPVMFKVKEKDHASK